MSKSFVHMLILMVVQFSLISTMTTRLFASAPPITVVPTSITGHVWIDSNASGNREQQEMSLANMPVYIQRLDESDFAMTLVVYTDEVGGFAAEGLPAGTYQIWTENDFDAVYLVVVTIDESSPVATADLPLMGHRLFVPTVMR